MSKITGPGEVVEQMNATDRPSPATTTPTVDHPFWYVLQAIRGLPVFASNLQRIAAMQRKPQYCICKIRMRFGIC